jgi:uracil-DNA glycosylase
LSTIAGIDTLRTELLSCRACEADLPLGPRPIFQISQNARLLIASQAPGNRAHDSGIPFSDASGDHLREWMGITSAEFYDANRIAIVPMAFCYPGAGGGGDAPPRPECAPLWRDRIIQCLASVELTLLVGSFAVAHALGPGRMSARVRDFESYLPKYFPLPHPSWRSRIWMSRNPWFAQIVLPRLKEEVRAKLRD